MNLNTMKIHDLKKIYTGQKIDNNQKLKYLFVMPCVNRLERNAIQVIHKTFENFEKNGLFDCTIPNVDWDFILLESGSTDTNYLDSISSYLYKYGDRITIIHSSTPLDGPRNILRLFEISHNISIKNAEAIDYIIWMDDDILVCENFLKNCDTWVRNYMNFTLFGSLYSPYHSFPINQNSSPGSNVKKSYIRSYHGSCCTIFKPCLAKYIIPCWFKTNLLRNVVEPDLRFRESLMKYFPNIQFFLVSYPSLVYHLNVGSAIYGHKQIKKGHQCREFIGVQNDPKWYIEYDSIQRNISMDYRYIQSVKEVETEETKETNIETNIISENNDPKDDNGDHF